MSDSFPASHVFTEDPGNGVYIELCNPRETIDGQDAFSEEDFVFIGPVDWVTITYMTEFRVKLKDIEEEHFEIPHHKGMVLFNGIYYADFSVNGITG